MASNPVLSWPPKPVSHKLLPVVVKQPHWKQWHCTDRAGTSQERFRPGKKRSLFPLPSKIAALDLWDATVVSGVPLLASTAWLQIYTAASFSWDALLSLSSKILASKSWAGVPWDPRKSIIPAWYCVWLQGEPRELFSSSCDSQMSDREEPRVWNAVLLNPHLQNSSVELKETHEF